MKPISLALTFLTITALPGLAQDRYGFIDTERALAARFGGTWPSLSPSTISAALVEMAESLPVSGAIVFYKSEFGAEKFAYSLLHVEVDAAT